MEAWSGTEFGQRKVRWLQGWKPCSVLLSFSFSPFLRCQLRLPARF